MFGIVILVVSVVASAGTGFFVFARNPRSTVNRVYGLLALSLVILSIANYFSLITIDRLVYIRIVVACSGVLVSSLYYLIFYLGARNAHLGPLRRLGVYFTAAVFVLDFTPAVFSGLQGTVSPTPIPNVGAAIFFAHLVLFLLLGAILLVKRIANSRGILRQQYIYMLVGVMPILLFAPITGFILPIILEKTDFIAVTPLYGAFFVCLIGYSIVKHKLFDIQFFVVRAAAYLTTLFAVTFLFITPFVLVVNSFFGSRLKAGEAVSVILASVVFVYLLQALRRYFDRLTNRIFYRHYYDPQDVLDKLSESLVRLSDLKSLQEETGSILEAALKPQLLQYVLFADLAQNGKSITQKIRDLSSGMDSELLDVDASTGNAAFGSWLKTNGFALAVQLRTKHEDLGLILLGHKQSGELYTERDKRLLGVAADEIAISLQNVLRFEQIQRFNITLQEEVEGKTRELQRKNKRLEELDSIKDDFISMASHQLRTPLTSVKGYLSMVLEGDAGKLNETQAQMLKQAFTSSQRMVFLITDLLNVSRLKTGKFIIDAAPTNLSDVVGQELDQLKETAALKNIELSYDKPAKFPQLMLDEVKIRQVVMNFVDNAIYYTPQGGHIHVELTEKPSVVELRVTDDGIGVPKSEQHHLFTKFYRATNARKARPDGTGLGLFMAQKVITAQGGSIIFSSQESKGSTFGFSFAKNRLQPKPVAQQVGPEPVAEPTKADKKPQAAAKR